MYVRMAGYFILLFMTVLLFGLGFIETMQQEGLILVSAILLLVFLALVYEKILEWLMTMSAEKLRETEFNRTDLFNFVSVVIGALITYSLSVDIALGAVVAAGMVAIFATLIAPSYDVPLYCGAFVGMACGELFPGYHQLLLAGVIAGLVFVASKFVFNGFGGKLGTIAFTGCVAAALLLRNPLQSSPVPDWGTGYYLILYSVIGAVVTFVLNVRLKHSAVISSGIVGLAGGLILPVVHPAIGEMLGVMVICASFAGMSSLERIPNEVVMAIAGVICALVFMFTSPYLGGAGGKLGTIAFGTVIALKGMIDFADTVLASEKSVFSGRGLEFLRQIFVSRG